MTRLKKLQLEKEQLEKLYLKEKLSTVDISKIFNVHYSTIRCYLDKYNIPIKNRSNTVKENTIKALLRENEKKKIKISQLILDDMYIEKKLSLRGIANIFHVDKETIRKRLLEFGIKRRNFIHKPTSIERKFMKIIARM